MEGSKKLISVLITVYLFCGLALAYNSSLTNPNDTITWDEIPDRLGDNIVKTGNEINGSFGQHIGRLVVIMLYFSIFTLFIWVLMRFKK